MDAFTEDIATPPRPRSPLFEGGFSMESLLASSLLHLAILLFAIVFAPNPLKEHHDGVVIDIGQFTLPESHRASGGAADKSAGETEAPVVSKAAPAETPVEIPAESAVADAQEPAPKDPPETRPAEESVPGAETAAAPAVPESTIPHEIGEYNPFEVYKAMVAERVKELTASSRNLPARMLFRGTLAVHLYLDATGLHLGSPKVCLGHSQVQLAANIPEAVARVHFNVLIRDVVNALHQGAPYPSAPPGVQIPEEMTYFIDLSAN